MRVEAIHKECQRKLAQGMRTLHTEATTIINDSFDFYYGGGYPKVYKRTDTLRGAEDVLPPVISGNIGILQAGYDGTKIGYSTGTFTGSEVFDSTISGTNGVVGDPSYDDLAFQQVIAAANAIFAGLFG